MSLLALEELTVAAGSLTILDRLSLALDAGEVVALVGESGSGKSMAARAAIGLLPQGVGVIGGRVRFADTDIATLPPATLRQLRGPGIGMVFQEPMVSLNPAHTIGAQLAEGLRLHTKLDAAEIRARSIDMLARVQIADPERCLGAYPHEFSGGMRQRLMIAAVMLLKPKLLIADEPTTALDTLTQREVLDLLLALTRDHGTAVLLITHNLGLVARYAARAAVLRCGRLVEEGGARRILFAPRDGYTRDLVDAVPRRPGRSARADAVPRTPLLVAEQVSVEYPGRTGLLRRGRPKQAVDRVSLTVNEGEFVAVVGGSGSGKTTLGRALTRMIPSAAGRILFRGCDVTRAAGHALREFRLACQIVFQDPYSSLDPRMTVAQIVAEPLRLVQGLDGSATTARVRETLAEVGLEGYGARYPHALSGGQRQRVAIARAIIRRPAFVMADEPVSALDMTIQKQVLALFKGLQKNHAFACLFISHDLAAVEQVADRVVVMQDGRIVEEGPTARLFDRPEHPYTRALLDAAPMLDPAGTAAA
ncbi:MAG: ABC transporter ATP-binding protein [Alphaproteobacteria bacterium]|nr:ABC transporter ATP-binding protein [Alphaproteobacteria bacterium]